MPAWEFALIARDGSGDLRESFSSIVDVLGVWTQGKDAASDQALVDRVRQWSPSIVYSNTAVNGDLVERLKLNVPVLVHVHEMGHYLQSLDQRRRELFLSVPERYLAVSRSAKNYLVETEGIGSEKIGILHEAIDTDRIERLLESEAAESQRPRIGLPEDAFVLGTVGRIDARKGWDLFAAAAAEIARKADRPERWRFVWLGHGPAQSDLANAFRANKLIDQLKILPPAANPFPIYRTFDIYAQASREDPCPLSVLEAAYLRLPLLVFSGSGGAPEVADQGGGISLPDFDPVKLAHAAVSLEADPEARQQMGALGRATIERAHSADHAASLLARELATLARL